MMPVRSSRRPGVPGVPGGPWSPGWAVL